MRENTLIYKKNKFGNMKHVLINFKCDSYQISFFLNLILLCKAIRFISNTTLILLI